MRYLAGRENNEHTAGFEMLQREAEAAAVVPGRGAARHRIDWNHQTIQFGNSRQYLIGEKFAYFARQSERDSAYAVELLAFVAEIQRLFTSEEIRQYLHGRRKFSRVRELLL